MRLFILYNYDSRTETFSNSGDIDLHFVNTLRHHRQLVHIAFLVYNAVEMIKTRNHYNDGLRVFDFRVHFSVHFRTILTDSLSSPSSRTARQLLILNNNMYFNLTDCKGNTIIPTTQFVEANFFQKWESVLMPG